MLFQDLQAILPVMLVEVIHEAVPGLIQHWAPSKGARALVCALWENDVKDLWDVICLTDR